MKSVTMDQIDVGREAVGMLITAKQAGDHAQILLDQIHACEVEINSMLARYHVQPDCPFCRKGKMIETPTKGRLECERAKCRSLALVGGSTLEPIT